MLSRFAWDRAARCRANLLAKIGVTGTDSLCAAYVVKFHFKLMH